MQQWLRETFAGYAIARTETSRSVADTLSCRMMARNVPGGRSAGCRGTTVCLPFSVTLWLPSTMRSSPTASRGEPSQADIFARVTKHRRGRPGGVARCALGDAAYIEDKLERRRNIRRSLIELKQT